MSPFNDWYIIRVNKLLAERWKIFLYETVNIREPGLEENPTE